MTSCWGTATLQFPWWQSPGGGFLASGHGAGVGPASYALLPFHVLLGWRGLLVLAALRAGFGRRRRAAGGGQEVGRLQHGLRVLPGLHAQCGHAGGAVALAAVGGQEGEAHGVRNAARAQRAPWGGRRQGSVIAGEGMAPPAGLPCGGCSLTSVG